MKLVLLLIFNIFVLSSCSYYNSTISYKKTLEDINNGIILKDYSNKMYKDKLFDKDIDDRLTKFFQDYYTININILPNNLNIQDYEQYNILKYKKVYDILSQYMSNELKNKILSENYDFEMDLPRVVDINSNVVVDYITVDNIDFFVINPNEDDYKIKVDVYLKAKTMNSDIFDTVYEYNNGYYKDINQSSNKHELDQHSLKVSYDLNCTIDNNKLFLNSIIESSKIFMSGKNKKENNYFVSVVPYKNNPDKSEISVIESFLDAFFGQSRESKNYFNSIQTMSFDIINDYYKDKLLVQEIILLDKKNYNKNFPQSISLIKDNIIDVKKVGKISFRSYQNSSFKYRRYYIDVPVKIIYFDKTKEESIYTYFIELNNEQTDLKVSSLKYLENSDIN